MRVQTQKVLTLTSPVAPGANVSVATGPFWQTFDSIAIDATIIGGTGGPVDLYVQRSLDPTSTANSDNWVDWIHFPQVAAGVTKYFTLSIQPTQATIVEVGHFNLAGAGTPVLAANTYVACLPSTYIRLYAVAGALTTAGAVQTVRLTGSSS